MKILLDDVWNLPRETLVCLRTGFVNFGRAVGNEAIGVNVNDTDENSFPNATVLDHLKSDIAESSSVVVGFWQNEIKLK